MKLNSTIVINDKQLKNSCVILKLLNFDDFDCMSEIILHPDLWKFFPNPIYTQEALKIFISDAMTSNKSKDKITFAVYDKKSSQLAGSTSLLNYSQADKRIEIGFTWIDINFQRKGVNRASKILLLKFAFESLKCNRVEFKTDVLNISARRSLTNLGATEEGVLRKHTFMHGDLRYRDTVYYSILVDEWEEIKKKNIQYLE